MLQTDELTSFYPEAKANLMVDIMINDLGNLLTFPMVGKIEPIKNLQHVRYILSGELRIIYSVHDEYIHILNVYHYKFQYLHVNLDISNLS